MASNPNELMSSRALAEQVVLTAATQTNAFAAAKQLLLTPMPQTNASAAAKQLLLVKGAVSESSVVWWVS